MGFKNEHDCCLFRFFCGNLNFISAEKGAVQRGSMAWFANGKNRGSQITDIKILFS